jgi:hypothetical protein
MLVRAAAVLCVFASVAAADDERPKRFELGLNTRHFTADHTNVAFRSTTTPDPSLAGGEGVTMSFRFTGQTPYSTYLGIEAEAGQMIGLPESNIAGGYGVAGARGVLGSVQLAAELVAGRRWVRYELEGKADPSTLIAEPRVRADVWLSRKLSLGGAVGATLSDRQVWMAGIYIGVHSNPFDR